MSDSDSDTPPELEGMKKRGELSTFEKAKEAAEKNKENLAKKGKLGGKFRSRRRSGSAYRKRSSRRRASNTRKLSSRRS